MPMMPVRSAGSVGLCIRLRCEVCPRSRRLRAYDDAVTDHDTAKLTGDAALRRGRTARPPNSRSRRPGRIGSGGERAEASARLELGASGGVRPRNTRRGRGGRRRVWGPDGRRRRARRAARAPRSRRRRRRRAGPPQPSSSQVFGRRPPGGPEPARPPPAAASSRTSSRPRGPARGPDEDGHAAGTGRPSRRQRVRVQDAREAPGGSSPSPTPSASSRARRSAPVSQTFVWDMTARATSGGRPIAMTSRRPIPRS